MTSDSVIYAILLNFIVYFLVNCNWTTWSTWGTCDSGTGLQERRRAKKPEALNGGADCTGNANETQDCPGRALFVTNFLTPI